MLFSIAECCLTGLGRNVQFYCEHFGTSLYDAATVVKERKFLADEESQKRWRACMMECVNCLTSDEFFGDNESL